MGPGAPGRRQYSRDEDDGPIGKLNVAEERVAGFEVGTESGASRWSGCYVTRVRWCSLTIVLLMACGMPQPRSGTVVTPGVAKARIEVRANGTDLIPVEVVFPADEAGRPTATSLPAVVFIHGGAVPPHRYEWQAVELAKAGIVTALPGHPLDLAFFAIDHGEWTRQALVAGEPGSFLDGLVDSARVSVGGHSLGGVVAMKLAVSGRFRSAFVQASYPDPADDAKTKGLRIPTLSLAGKLDCMAREPQVRAGWATLPSPSALVVLEGVTHYQFTQSDQEDVARQCLPTLSLEDAHARIAQVMKVFLAAAPPDVGERDLRLVPGSEVEVR